MSQLKKAWLTPWDGGMAMLSLASARPEQEYTKLNINERSFPDRVTGEPRHTVTVGLLDEEDLEKLYVTLQDYLFSTSHSM